MQEPSDRIQSVSRALRVLEVVGEAPEGLPAKVVARRCGLNLSTAYHLLRTLTFEGYLTRTPTGDYALGLEIADRFRDLMATLARPPQAGTVLRHLAETTGHTAYLARFVDGRVAIAQVVEAPGSPPLEDLIPGFDEGAHATALGKALLSTLPPHARHDYLRETGLRPFTPATIRRPDALDEELAGVADGVFTEQGQYRDAVSCAAVLVPTSREDDPWWAIAVSAAADVFTRRAPALRAALREAAGRLAAQPAAARG